MAITSTSTLAEIRAEYLANVGYTTVSGATAFATACRALLMMLPTDATSGSKRSVFGENIRQIQKELERAERFIAVNRSAGNGGGNRAFDLSGSRC